MGCVVCIQNIFKKLLNKNNPQIYIFLCACVSGHVILKLHGETTNGLEGFQLSTDQKRQLFNPFDTSADDDILNVSSLS